MPKRKLGAKKQGGEGGSARKQPPPGDTDDGSKWSKSKKKRMRAKLAKQQSARRRGGGDGSASPDQRPGKHQQEKGRSALINDHKRKKKRQKKNEQPPQDNGTADEAGKVQQPRELNTSVRAKSALQQSFLARLSGSRFRELNEDLYTTTSDTAFQRFSENPELFDQYHKGFRKQVSQWPVNPVDVIIRWIRKKGAQKQGSREGSLVIADFGCGDAKLGQELGGQGSQKVKKQKKQNDGSKNMGNQFMVHSFDLVANGNPLITPCDMANVPLENGVVDIAVFCLALMGTNIADFIRESHRVLKPDGVIKIAEVRSRFEATGVGDDGHCGGASGGGKKKTDDSLLNEFIDTMDKLGFECTQKDRSNKMFILMEFAKTGEKPSAEATFTARPCIYKRR